MASIITTLTTSIINTPPLLQKFTKFTLLKINLSTILASQFPRRVELIPTTRRNMDQLKFTVNGQEKSVQTDPGRTLLDLLREEFQLTGAKYGCGEGRCGACTVLMNGKRIFSCRTSIEDVAGKTVLTIEGLAKGDELHPLQQAFLDAGAFQCGFCTPGMILNAVQLCQEKPKASDEEIVAWMSRNICRCCSYNSIHKAVSSAVAQTGR